MLLIQVEAKEKRDAGRAKKKQKKKQDSVVKLESPAKAAAKKEDKSGASKADSTATSALRPKSVAELSVVDTSGMTKEELKRHQKILRRAERREMVA